MRVPKPIKNELIVQFSLYFPAATKPDSVWWLFLHQYCVQVVNTKQKTKQNWKNNLFCLPGTIVFAVVLFFHASIVLKYNFWYGDISKVIHHILQGHHMFAKWLHDMVKKKKSDYDYFDTLILWHNSWLVEMTKFASQFLFSMGKKPLKSRWCDVCWGLD